MSIVLLQENENGVVLNLTYTKGGGSAAVTAVVQLATVASDNERFLNLYLDLIDKGDTQVATASLTTAQLQQLYGDSAATSSYATTNLKALATAYSDDFATAVGGTQTQLTNAGGNISALSFINLPTPGTPNLTSATGQDKYVTVNFTATVDENYDLVKTNNKATVFITLCSGLGIQNYEVESSSSSSTGAGTGTLTYTISARTPDDSQVNANVYEISARVKNANGWSAASNTLGVTPGNMPNAPTQLTVNTAYSSGTTLDTTNAAVLTAIFQDADAGSADSTQIRFGAMSDATTFIAEQSATLSFTVTTGGNDTHTGVNGAAVGNMNVPLAWYANATNGGRGDVTSLAIWARIEQTTGGATSNGDRAQFNSGGTGLVYKIVLPTISAITVSSVSGAGLQTFNLASGGTAVDATPTATSTYNGNTSNVTVSNYDAGADTFTIDSFTLGYDAIDAGSNGDLTVTVSLPDANGTEQNGSVVAYTASSTQAIHAFKDAAAPTPGIVQPAVTLAPTVSVTAQGANNGYTFQSYTHVVRTAAGHASGENIVVCTHAGKTDGSAFVASANGGGAYAIGNYDVEVTKVLGGIPAFYNGKYTLSAPSATSGTVKFFQNPTITSVSFSGAKMIITLNTGGSDLSAQGAVSSVGFIGTATDYSMSLINNGTAAGDGSTTVELTHGGSLLTNIGGGATDGLAILNPSNANSAFSLVTNL